MAKESGSRVKKGSKQAEGKGINLPLRSWSSVSSSCPFCSSATKPKWVHTARGSKRPDRGGHWSKPPSGRWLRSPGWAGHSGWLASCGTDHRCSLWTGGERESARGDYKWTSLCGRERARLCATDMLLPISPLCTRRITQPVQQRPGLGDPSLAILIL